MRTSALRLNGQALASGTVPRGSGDRLPGVEGLLKGAPSVSSSQATTLLGHYYESRTPAGPESIRGLCSRPASDYFPTAPPSPTTTGFQSEYGHHNSSDYAFSRVSSVNSLVSIAPSVTSLASSRRSSSGDSIQGYTKHGTTSSKKRRATRPEDDTSSSSSTGESAHACQQRGYRGKNNVAMQNTQGHMVQCGWRGETKQRPNNKQGDGSKPGCGLEYTKLEIATAQCQYDNFSRALYRLLGLRDQDMARIGPLLRYFPTEVCATEEQLAKLDSTLVGAISSDEQLARRVAALRPDLAPRLLRGFTPPSTPM